MMANRPSGRLVAALVIAMLFAGCGNDAADEPVAVRINAGEIPVPQVQAVLKRQPRLLAEQPDTATARVVEVLVDQELAAQAAAERGLEREPEVVQALALARREVLARAWQERLAQSATVASRGEIEQFHDAHPLLFAQRRIYTVQEFSIDATPAQAAAVATIARRARHADDVAALLRDAGLGHRTQRYANAAEDLPATLLESLAALEPGQSVVLSGGAAPRIITLLDTHAAPVDRALADEAIAAHLAAERRRVAVATAMKGLRDAAQIHYGGGFARAPVVGPRVPPAAPG